MCMCVCVCVRDLAALYSQICLPHEVLLLMSLLFVVVVAAVLPFSANISVNFVAFFFFFYFLACLPKGLPVPCVFIT